MKMEENETDGRFRVMTVEDWGGWRCSLERWFSEWENEWFTGVTVHDSDGREVLHAGMTGHEMTMETALSEIEAMRSLVPALARFADGKGAGDGVGTR